jgi:hypothetical protein
MFQDLPPVKFAGMQVATSLPQAIELRNVE